MIGELCLHCWLCHWPPLDSHLLLAPWDQPKSAWSTHMSASCSCECRNIDATQWWDWRSCLFGLNIGCPTRRSRVFWGEFCCLRRGWLWSWRESGYSCRAPLCLLFCCGWSSGWYWVRMAESEGARLALRWWAVFLIWIGCWLFFCAWCCRGVFLLLCSSSWLGNLRLWWLLNWMGFIWFVLFSRVCWESADWLWSCEAIASFTIWLLIGELWVICRRMSWRIGWVDAFLKCSHE